MLGYAKDTRWDSTGDQARNTAVGRTLLQRQALEQQEFGLAIWQFVSKGVNRARTVKQSYTVDKGMWVLLGL